VWWLDEQELEMIADEVLGGCVCADNLLLLRILLQRHP
jgi:hypothetical protein